MTLVDIYVRISSAHGESDALARQEEDCRQHAESCGWRVRTVHVDDGRSAYAPTSDRPGLARLLGCIALQVPDVVVVWRLDRLTRRGRMELGLILDLFEAHGVRLISLMDRFDSAIDDREFALRFADAASLESQALAQRVRSAHQRSRSRGVFITGRVPYGMQKLADGSVRPHPSEGPRLRVLADCVLSGSSLTATARFANEAGWLAPLGGEWQVTTLSQLLRNPVIAGLTSEAIKRADGRYTSRTRVVEHPRHGEAIQIGVGVITAEEHRKICERLSQAQRVLPGGVRQVGLRGLIFCASCGRPMHLVGRSYTCSSQANGTTCAAPARAYVPAVDREVSVMLDEHLLEDGDAWCARVARRMALMERPAIALRIELVREALTGSVALAPKRREALAAQLEVLTAGLPTRSSAALSEGLQRDGLAILARAAIRRIDLDPGGGRGKRFDAARLRISWLP